MSIRESTYGCLSPPCKGLASNPTVRGRAIAANPHCARAPSWQACRLMRRYLTWAVALALATLLLALIVTGALLSRRPG